MIGLGTGIGQHLVALGLDRLARVLAHLLALGPKPGLARLVVGLLRIGGLTRGLRPVSPSSTRALRLAMIACAGR